MPHETKPDRIDEVASDLDDVKLAVDELEIDPPDGVRPSSIDSLKRALDGAIDAVDDLENEKP